MLQGYGRKGAALFGMGKLEEAEKAYTQGLQYDAQNAAIKRGLEDVKAAKASAANMSGDSPFGNIFQGDVIAKLASNPQTSHLLSDPALIQKVLSIQKNPETMMQHMQDPKMMQVIGALLGVNIMSGADAASSMATEDQPSLSEEKTESKVTEEEHVEVPMDVEPELSAEEQAERERKDSSVQAKQAGNQLYKNKEFDAALKQYAKAWELDSSDITILTNKAAVYFEQGEYDQCIKTCDEAVEKGREIRADYKIIAKAYGRIGNAYLKKDDLESAIKFYEKSLSEHRAADILAKLKDTQKLSEQRKRESYQDPAKSDEARNKGNDFFKAGNFAEAVIHYTEAIKRAEKDPRAYSNRSACYSKLMAVHEALKDAEKAIELDPTFVKAFIRKAAIQFTMKEYSKCIQTCDEAMIVDSEHHNSKFAAEIEGQKQKAAMAVYGYPQDAGEDSGLSQEERAKKGMQDPKVQEIMADPVMRQILEQMSNDPAAARSHMQNPMIREKIQVLAAAGIIGMR
eukprot:Partr_v1_DN26728_c0_g1_i4_m8762 putative Heat shock protein